MCEAMSRVQESALHMPGCTGWQGPGTQAPEVLRGRSRTPEGPARQGHLRLAPLSKGAPRALAPLVPELSRTAAAPHSGHPPTPPNFPRP